MALEIDGLAILCAIAETPQAFPAIRHDVAKAAQALVVRQLKAKDMTVDGLRRVQAALGPHPLALLVDGLTDAEVKTLVTRFDKHGAALKAGGAVELRRRLLALAGGAAPEAKPVKVAAKDAAKDSAKDAAKAPAKTIAKRPARAPARASAGPARDASPPAPEPATPRPPAGHALDSAAMAAVPPRRRRSPAS
ncbi:hypothetical protein M446_1848 [Methylobacterium sp. 4-46]|uniref:hypothetical protein n=1 Tax=Methylobacterium sp. (strain 4-46) TaxID=426117 RepID=UPI000165C9AD|nr:hypothetical protein [Methylobacterium sp. 4-46]ACA16331.1 hypothetical protein M446_1848 [Methylobacterium sp. 4-46]